MEKENQPLVSIGVPVFNGEKQLAHALDSLLAQDYTNLEIVISDNASTDATSEICQKYALRDSRVKYSRSEKNFGASWNFNRVFELSSGKYFVWAAHDDRRERSFVSACVEGMERFPTAVACHVQTEVSVQDSGEVLCFTHLDSFKGITELKQRYRETLEHAPATIVYGLFRSSAMRKTRMVQKIFLGDVVFVQELSIYGEFIQVRKPLFKYAIRKKWNTIDQDYFVFFGKRKPWWFLPFVAMFYNHCKGVAYSRVSFGVKLNLWWVLIANEIKQVALKVMIKVVGQLFSERQRKKLGSAIYWRWIHSPNMQVGCKELFRERMIHPNMGLSR